MDQRPLPPHLLLRFFRWYCHPRLVHHIEGDLLEVYGRRVATLGRAKANRLFMVDVLLLFRPGIIRPVQGYRNVNTFAMYKSYFVVGWRNLVRNFGYSFINIGGLAVGMAVAILIGLWVHDELTFNQYYKHYNTIAQVARHTTRNGERSAFTYMPYDLGDELAMKYGADFRHVVRAWPVGEHVLGTDEKKLSLPGEFIDAAGPEMFGLRMTEGSLSGLNDVHAILLAQSTARALFGNTPALNHVLKINNSLEARVAGVYEDLPANAHFHDVKFFAPLELLAITNGWMKYQGFKNNLLGIYVQLNEHTTLQAASAHIREALMNNLKDDKDYVTLNPQLFLHPMKDWHLRSEGIRGANGAGLERTVWLFGTVGLFVLLLACINFMNLSTARSMKRAKEVGVRKAIGSARGQLVGQFFSESLLVVALAFVFAVAMVTGTLSWFNDLAGKQLAMPWTTATFWAGSAAFIAATGLLAGSYPALYLSSFNAMRALKGSLRLNRFASVPRKVLVVTQFSVSVALIIGTIIVYKQIRFAKDRAIGYTPGGLLMMPITTSDYHEKFDALRTELINTGVVTEVSKSSSPPTDIWNTNGGFDWQGKDPNMIPELSTFTVAPQYGKTMQWQLVQGRDFDEGRASDSSAFIINQSAARLFGFANPVGETVQWQSWWTNGPKNFTIIGVIGDVVMTSPYTTPAPAVYFLGGGSNWINVRLHSQAKPAEALATIEAVLKKTIPSVPFDYKFADEQYALKFAAEERIGKLSAVFASLAIFISCLGLSGLAAFVAEQRTKEIGIRKVVGASVFSLWRMLSWEFVLLVMVACAVSIPFVYLFMRDWLSGYAYRMEMSWWIFAVATLGALAVTLATISYQALRAAWANPVKSLRSE